MVGVALPSGAAETAGVYKCREANGAVLYADYPCQGAVAFEIKPSVVDPEAASRLERAKAEFDRAYARRMASEEMAATRREALNQRSREADAAQRLADSYAPDPGYAPAYGLYLPQVTSRPDFRRHAKHHRRVPAGRVPAVIRRPHGPG